MTSEERREVAERLRRQLKYMRDNDSYREDVDVLGCGNTAYRNIAWAVDENSNWEKGLYTHIVERLADLIDPTCHIVLRQSDSDFTDEPHYMCSRCGKESIYVYERNDYTLAGIVSHAPYCSNCGARVVSG